LYSFSDDINLQDATKTIRVLEKSIEIPIIAFRQELLLERDISASRKPDFLIKPLLKQTLCGMIIKWFAIEIEKINNKLCFKNTG